MKIYDNKCESVRKVFESARKKYEKKFDALLELRTKGERVTLLLHLLDELFMELPFGKCFDDGDAMDIRGWQVRMFNGEYYEKVYSQDIYHELSRWLVSMKVDSNMIVFDSAMINREVRYFIGRRIIEPRKCLMCFKNGVVDFGARHIELKPFSPDWDVIKQYDFEFDMSLYNKCYKWEAFLGNEKFSRPEIFPLLPEPHKRRMLQMFLGALLCDRTKVAFEHFMILQGGGGNGKSVIFKVLSAIFGKEEVGNIQISQFAQKGDERLRAAASLEHKRLVFSPDEGSSALKDISLLKSIASGESIAIRKIGSNIGVLETSPIVMMNTNAEWKLKDFVFKDRENDKSVLRRVVILPFERNVPKEMRDASLFYKLCEEKAAIFAWIVKGFMELRLNGYRMPDDVGMQHQLEIDNARSFVQIGMVNVDGSIPMYMRAKGCVSYDLDRKIVEISPSDLFLNYSKFCAEYGIHPVGIQVFGKGLSAMGYRKVKREDGDKYCIYWIENKTAETFLGKIPSIHSGRSFFTGEVYSEEMFKEDFGLK